MNKFTILFLLGLGCTAPDQRSPAAAPLAFLRAAGDTAVRIDGTAALRKYAPEAFALVDVAPPDGVITLAEIEVVANATQDPVQLTWLALMVRGMIEARN